MPEPITLEPVIDAVAEPSPLGFEEIQEPVAFEEVQQSETGFEQIEPPTSNVVANMGREFLGGMAAFAADVTGGGAAALAQPNQADVEAIAFKKAEIERISKKPSLLDKMPWEEFIKLKAPQRAGFRSPTEEGQLSIYSDEIKTIEARIAKNAPTTEALTDFQKLASEASKEARTFFGQDPARQDEFLSQLAQGAGSLPGYIATGMVGGPVASMLAGALQTGANEYDAAIESGHPELANEAREKGMLIGLTEGLGVGGGFEAAGKTFAEKAFKVLKRSVKEGGQEWVQNTLSNFNAMGWTGYDPSRPLFKGSGRAGAIGMILGGGVEAPVQTFAKTEDQLRAEALAKAKVASAGNKRTAAELDKDAEVSANLVSVQNYAEEHRKVLEGVLAGQPAPPATESGSVPFSFVTPSARSEPAPTTEGAEPVNEALLAQTSGSALPTAQTEPAPEPTPPDTEPTTLPESDFPVTRVATGEIATRPDLMQFKRMDEPTTGTNEAERLQGTWDELKAGLLLLWEPKDKAAYGLAEGQRFIVANGHHRFEFGERQNVPAYNAQIVREADGVSATDAMAMAAEINIADNKGTIYDQAKYIRNISATHGPDEAIASAQRVGARGKQATTIALNAADDTFTAFINERISPAHAEAISARAPGNAVAQRAGVKAALKGKDALESGNVAAAATVAEQHQKATDQDLFGEGTFTKYEDAAAYATKEQRRIRDDINAIRSAARKPEVLAKYGINVKDPAAIERKITALKAELARWENWVNEPDLLAKAMATPVPPAQTDGHEPLSSQTIPKVTATPPSDLFQGATDDPFNLVSETKAERDARIARELAEARAKEEEAARKAREEADRDQGRLFAKPQGTQFMPGSKMIHNGRQVTVTADRGDHVEAVAADNPRISFFIPKPAAISPEEVREHVNTALNEFDTLLANVGHPTFVFTTTEPNQLMYVAVDQTGEPRIFANWTNVRVEVAGLSSAEAAAEIRQMLFHEVTHVAQIRFERENPILTNQFHDWITNENNPEYDAAFVDFMRRTYPGWDQLKPYQKTGEAARVIIEKRWMGRITEQAKLYLTRLLDWLNAYVFGFEDRPSYVQQYVTGVEDVLRGRIKNLQRSNGPYAPSMIQASNATVISPDIARLMALAAHHGTPHDVEAFLLSRVGTGEGAQAYGWGLYFAQAEAVARSYRDGLSRPTFTVDEVPFYVAKGVEPFRDYMMARYGAGWPGRARDFFREALFDYWHDVAVNREYPQDAARKANRRFADRLRENNVSPERISEAMEPLLEIADGTERPWFSDEPKWSAQVVGGIRQQRRFTEQELDAFYDLQGSAHWWNTSIDAKAKIIELKEDTVKAQNGWADRYVKEGNIEAAMKALATVAQAQTALRLIRENVVRFVVSKPPGNLYNVSLEVEPDELLRWDRSLNDQPRQIQDALLSIAEKNGPLASRVLSATSNNAGSAVYAIVAQEQDVSDVTAAPPGMSLERYQDFIRHKRASEFLLSLGIQGITYPDEMSRGKLDPAEIERKIADAREAMRLAEQADLDEATKERIQESHLRLIEGLEEDLIDARNDPPTFNYVMFDDSRIRITHENGLERTPSQELRREARPTRADDAWQRLLEGDDDAIYELDAIKRARYGNPPTGKPGEARPARFYSPDEFERFFEQAYAVKDFDALVDAVKASDVAIYGPVLKKFMRGQASDPDLAARADWMRHVFNGTRPPDARAPSATPTPGPTTATPPRSGAAPPPGGAGGQQGFAGAGFQPPPPPVPPRPSGKHRFNVPALVYLARLLGSIPQINEKLRSARGRFVGTPGAPQIQLHAHLFKNPVQAAKTLAHEIGHFFDFIPANATGMKQLAEKLAPLRDWRAVFGPLWDWSGHKISRVQELLRDEAVNLSKAWRGPFGPTDRYRNSADELYADFLSAVLNDPEWAFTAAPNLSSAFFRGIENKPAVEDAYNLVNEMLRGNTLPRILREEQAQTGLEAIRRVVGEAIAKALEVTRIRHALTALWAGVVNRYGPTAWKAGGYWKSNWDRHQNYGFSYTDQQEDAATYSSREISLMYDRLKAGTYIPLQANGISADNLDTYLRNRRIIYEATATGLYLQTDPDEARSFLLWMAEAAGLLSIFQNQIESASDSELFDLGGVIIQRIHEQQNFEQVYRAAQRRDAPAYAERGLFAWDVSGYMLNPQGVDVPTARAQIAQIASDLGPDRFRTLQEAAANYYATMRGIMEDAYRLGLIRPKQWAERIQPNLDNYVPFMVLDYFTGHADAAVTHPRKGTAKDVLPTHLAGQLKAAAILRRMQRQKQALIQMEFYQNEGVAFGFGSEMTLHDELTRQQQDQLRRDGRGLMGYYDRGVWRWMEFEDAGSIKAFENFDPDDLSPILNVLRQNSTAWRLWFTTYSLGFTIFNALRTLRTSFERGGTANAVNFFRAFPLARAYASSIVRGTPMPAELRALVERNVLPPPEHSLAGQMEPNQLEQMILSGMVAAYNMHGESPAKITSPILRTINRRLSYIVDGLAWISGVVESSPKIARFQTATGVGAPAERAAAYARLEGIPNPGISGKYNKALEIFLMFARVHIQGLRAMRTNAYSVAAPNETMSRGGFLMRAMLSQFMFKAFYVAAAAGIIDKLFSGGDDDDERMRDWEEFVKRTTPYKLEMGDIAFLGWVRPDGKLEFPWGHRYIPADWTPLTMRIPHSEDGRYVSPLSMTTISGLSGSELRPVQPGNRLFQIGQSFVPGMNPSFDMLRAVWSWDNDFAPQDDYRGQPMVSQDEWQAGAMSKTWGLAKYMLQTVGVPGFTQKVENPDLNWFWTVVRQTPGLGRLVPLDNYGGVREMRRDAIETQQIQAKARLMRGEETVALNSRYTALSHKGAPDSEARVKRTDKEETEYQRILLWKTQHYEGTSQNPAKMDIIRRYVAGDETVDGKQAAKDLEQAAKEAREEIRAIAR